MSKRLETYLDDETIKRIQDAAKRSKLSVSTWLKLVALEKLDRDEYRQRKEGEK